MSTRFGLQQLSTSARNSPFGQEKTVFEGKQRVEPMKIAHLKRYQPLIPSPLATSSFFAGEDKENAETQTNNSQTSSIVSQTTVTIPHMVPKLTAEDLSSEKPTANYFHVMIDQMKKNIEEEEYKNISLNTKLSTVREEVRNVENDLEILKEVIGEIRKTQSSSILSQTIVSIPHKVPKITEDDLVSEKPTANYFHVLVERMKRDIEDEEAKNLELNRQLADVREEVNKVDRELVILKEVIEEIEEDKEVKQEEGSSQL